MAHRHTQAAYRWTAASLGYRPGDGDATPDAAGLFQAQCRILDLIARSTPVADVLREIALLVERLAAPAICSILFLDAEGRHLRHGTAPSLPLAYTQAIDGIAIGPGVGSCGTAAFRRQTVVVRDVESDPLWADYRDIARLHGLRACWSQPIMGEQDRVLGTFALYYREPRGPGPADFHVIEAMARLVRVALAQQSKEDALRQSTERFRNFAEAASDWFWEQDADLRFTYVSESDFRLPGITPQTPIGKTRRETAPLGVSEERWARHEADLLARRPFRDFRLERIDETGRRHTVLVSGAPAFDADGRFAGYRGVGRDITDLVEASERSHRAETRLRDALDSLPIGLILWDGNDRLAMHNRTIIDLRPDLEGDIRLGTSFEQILVTRVRSGLFPEAVGREEAFIRERVACHRNPGDAPIDQDYVDGRKLRIFERRTREGGVISVYLDVSAEKAAERELRRAKEAADDASRAKSSFLAQMSHELRTPLNAILGFSEVMVHGLFGPLGSERYKHYLDDIHASARHLLSLVNDILDLSRIESTSPEATLEPLDPRSVIEEITDPMALLASQRNITLQTACAAGTPAFTGDRRAMRQVLLNLLSNAIKFSGCGGTVRLTVEAIADGRVRFRVADTGRGIPAGHLADLGKPFVRIDDPYSSNAEGTGLGLAISKALATAMHADLSIESELGRGTTVTLDLPAARP